jgi:sterol desaturase/sphingolipid hydroxylase (fatty acid hydroxylase superfamily)
VSASIREKAKLSMMKSGTDPKRVRLFRNDLLERFTLISPVAFALTWTVFLAVALWASWGVTNVFAWVGLVFAGLLIWSLFEYAMHRFLFHLKLESRFGRALIFLTHGNHHTVPNDRMRNIMPPVVSVTISLGVWALLYAAFGPAGSVVFLGFGIGYVSYDCVHYACHQMPMRGPVLRQLRRHHLRHHHAREEGNYAITAIFWDWVFGTEVPAKRR